MRFLVTRPEPGASATQTRLRAMGHEAELLPCLEIFALPAKLPAHPAALLVTSGQAIPALPAALHNIPAFCVGDATATRLRAAGFTRVESANGDAKALARLVMSRGLPGPHVLATGTGLGLELAAALRAAGLTVIRRCVYKTTRRRRLPQKIRAALAAGRFDGALFYSAETASAFAALRPPGTAAMHAYALSRNVAGALQNLPWGQIHVALAPTEADLMALLA